MAGFFAQFIKNPSQAGAILPSSTALSKLITISADLQSKNCIVELGSGTGVFTKQIISKCSQDSTFFSLEINKRFVEETKRNCPEAIVYHASADDLQRYLAKHKQEKSDCIISGL